MKASNSSMTATPHQQFTSQKKCGSMEYVNQAIAKCAIAKAHQS